MNDHSLLNNRYYLQEQIGTGGMAVVYKAEDRMLERTVAIKVLREKFSADPAFRERFRQEAKAAANLSHPNIVTVHDFGLDSDRLFIVMEHIPGTDLKSIVEERGRFSVEEAIPILVQICAGVGYAHRAGLVHCDMKPHNVLVSPDMRVKVTDFGIARALVSIRPDEKSEIVWGSPQYFAPEQAMGRAPSPASDVYGIGVLMYEMLTGVLPFESDSGAELARMHRELRPILPSHIVGDISPVLEKIMLKILSKEPSSRYRTADQLGRVLLTFGKSEDVVETPDVPAATAVSKRRNTPPRGQVYQAPVSEPVKVRSFDILDIDWLGVLLGLLAVVAVGGLIPFGLWVFFQLNPP
jgi:serine/threonine-protein kinase